MTLGIRTTVFVGPGALLSYCCMIADGLPTPAPAHPDTRVAIWTAEVLAELVAFDIGTGSDDRGIAVDSHHHIADVHCLVAELAAPADRDCFPLGCDLAERSDRDVIFRQCALGKFRVAMKCGLLGLPLHVDDLPDRILIGRLKRRPGPDADMRGRERR